jgi:hypothetical protein
VLSGVEQPGVFGVASIVHPGQLRCLTILSAVPGASAIASLRLFASNQSAAAAWFLRVCRFRRHWLQFVSRWQWRA